MKKGKKRVAEEDEYLEVDPKTILNILKNNWNWVILILIIIFAFNIRLYHADYPVVGYHAWKETHYLTEARNFAEKGFFEHGFFVPEADFTAYNKDPSGAHSDTFPVTSVLLAIVFKITGPSLLAARLFGIIFNLGTIAMLYLFMRKLFKREDLALLVAFLAAINPLFVFFGRNVQLMSPGVFFMVTSAYYFLVFRESEEGKHLIYTMLFLVLATLTKYPYIFIAVPMVVTFPWKKFRKNYKKYLKPMTISALFVLFLIFWFIYSNYYIAGLAGNQAVGAGTVKVGQVFTSTWWADQKEKGYLADNFTHIGFVFALIGIGLSIVFYKKKSFGNKWLLANLAGTVIFLIVMSNKLRGHNYHWFPAAPYIIIMMGYFIFFISFNGGKLLATLVKSKGLKSIVFHATKIIVMIIFLLIIWNPSTAAMNRMWDTQYFGLDVAGSYINQNAGPEDRLIHSDHQSYAVVWYADRKGYAPPKTVEALKKLEDEFNVKWILIYQWGIPTFRQNQEVWDYIASSYSLKQLAFFQQQDQVSPVYFLFQKGGSYNESQLNDMVQGKPIFTQNYETKSQGTVSLSYMNI